MNSLSVILYTMPYWWWGLFVVSYMVGSIPFGAIFAWIKGVDLTKEGSGSTGATNAGRILGPLFGFVTLVLDAGKGILCVAATLLITRDIELAAIAGLCAAIGHCWSIFLGFKGGRGVAVTLGVTIMISPAESKHALLFWALMILATRIVSVASLSATLFLAFAAYSTTLPAGVRLAVYALVVLTWFTHRGNIRKLWRGEEKPFRFGGKSK